MDRSPNYRWIVMGLFWAFNAANTMGMTSLMIMLPTLRKDLGITPIQVGWLSSVGWLVPALTTIALGAWVSRFSPRKSTAVSVLLAGIFLVGQGWAPTYALEILCRVGFVAMIVARQPAGALLTQQWFSQREVTRINSLSGAANASGWVVGNAITPIVMIAFGDWRPTFYLLGLAHLLGGLVWLFLGRDRTTAEYRSREQEETENPLGVLIRYKALWLIGIGHAGAAFAWGAFVTFIPLFLVDVRGLTLTVVGPMMVVFSFGALVGSFSSGIIADRWGRQKPILWTAGLAQVACYLGIVMVPSLPIVAFLLFVAACFAWVGGPVTISIPFQLPGIKPREVAVAIALITTWIPVGATLGPLIAGYLQETTGSLQLALLVCGLAAINLTIFGLLIPETGWRASYPNRLAAIVGQPKAGDT
ncbi:MAG: MFS transporter [Chloroflexi bacterium]|nr:MFS transporter [Chloroflexota bacterium]